MNMIPLMTVASVYLDNVIHCSYLVSLPILCSKTASGSLVFEGFFYSFIGPCSRNI